jgi:hypothetical protein
MNKKTLKVTGLVTLVATLILIFAMAMPVISKLPASGTCCYQYVAKCAIEAQPIQDHYYFKSEGPCP